MIYLKPFAKDCGYNGAPFKWDEERRFLLRCELDAAYFHLYGIERDDSVSNPSYRPWAIARILPNAQVYIVSRFRNRQDAHDHKRVLHRFIPAAKFEIVFDFPNEEQLEIFGWESQGSA